MFDVLNSVRDSWENGIPIVVVNDLGDSNSKLILPSQALREDTAKIFIKNTLGDFEISLPHRFCQKMNIPLQQTMHIGLSSRYHSLGKLMTENSSINPYSISIELRETSERSYKTLTKISQGIGDLIDNYSSKETSTSSLYDSFVDKFTSPGFIKLLKCASGGLKQQNRYCELGLALASITNFSLSVIMATLIDADANPVSQSNLDEIIDDLGFISIQGKLILDLWRSIFKITKQEIEYL